MINRSLDDAGADSFEAQAGRRRVVDVALVPRAANPTADVVIVVDQINASSTITTILDGGVAELYVAASVAAARRVGAATDALLAGEWHSRRPAGFDFDNSPSDLADADLAGRTVVLSSTNGTRVLGRVRAANVVLVGCLRNATAVASAAVALSGAGARIQVVCAGSRGRFVIDDAVAAAAIVSRLRSADPEAVSSDAAEAVVRLASTYPTALAAMQASFGGATLRQIGAEPDIAFVSDTDASASVGRLVPGIPMRIERVR